VIGAPGEGQVTCSELDRSICIWTCFLRRFGIWTGQFEIPIVAPNMARSMMLISGKCDLLRSGWFNLHPDSFCKEIQNLDNKIINIADLQPMLQATPGRGGQVTSSQ
jgi:hypothetical protein